MEGGLVPARVAYLGLGSNQGDRLANLHAARAALPARGVTVLATATVFETAPQGELLDQADFLNTALQIETTLEPLDLLDACKAVERELGREGGGPRHGPRPIDVDVLLLDDVELQHERLTLPHPEVTSRRFVLAPLLELDAALALPDGTPLAASLDAVADQRVEGVGPL